MPQLANAEHVVPVICVTCGETLGEHKTHNPDLPYIGALCPKHAHPTPQGLVGEVRR